MVLPVAFLFLQLSALSSCFTVLVVNGGSFIGYHCAVTLSERTDTHVVVVDDINQIKSQLVKQRALKLSDKTNVDIYQGDICDNDFLMELFNQHDFSTVIYSPVSEHDVNRLLKLSTECMANLLEMLRKNNEKNTVLIFLSPRNEYHQSSSSSIEFALELSAEEMVSTYCQLYGVPIIILHILNVYGPWSGPGNIVHDIAEQIYLDKDLQMPLNSFLKQDFTYIDDVSAAIRLSLDHTPRDCSVKYNIGSGESVLVNSIVELLTYGFKNPNKLSDSLTVNSSVSLSELTLSNERLKYFPKVTIQKGISLYVNWFKDNFDVMNNPKHFMASTSIVNEASKKHVKYKSERYLERIHGLRQKYEIYAEEHGYAVSKLFRNKNFVERSGYTFKGGNNQKTKDLHELKYRCEVFDECIGYDSNGIIKGVLDPESSWLKSHGSVYIADVDVCKAGVHKCYGNASCISSGLGQFKCACPHGWKLYHDHDCIELYKPGYKTQAEIIEEITDKIDGLDWNSFNHASFHPFKGKTLQNEYLAYYPEAKNNIELLTEACISSYHCMGFTSDGVLMTNVDVRKWIDDSSVTLYARDVDYCSVDEVLCKPGQKCQKLSPGKWACG